MQWIVCSDFEQLGFSRVQIMHETSTNIHRDNGICTPVDRLNQFAVDLVHIVYIFDLESTTNTAHGKILGEKRIGY